MNKVNTYLPLLMIKYLLFVCIFLLLGVTNISANTPIDRIAAVVNNDVVMLSEIDKRAKLLRATSKQAARLSPAQLRVAALDDLILEKIQLQQAKERGIEIDSIQLNKTLEKIAAKNRMSLGQFRQALQREGMDYKNYREQVRNRMIMEALRQRQVDKHINVSQQEIEDLIVSQSNILNKGVQYKLQHILVSAPNGTPIAQVNAAKKRAEDLRKKVIETRNFDAIARSSSDNNAAKNGGHLGWQAAENLPASFNRVLALLDVGAISEVVRDPTGFHILKLLDKRGGAQQGKGIITKAHVRHILIKVDNKRTDAQARQEITKIRQQIEAGANFADLARKYSDDLGSKANGGDLGWVSETSLVPQFANVMKQQAVKTLSTPFRTQYGWHILEVLEKRQVDNTPEKLKLKAQAFLGQRKLEEEYEAWLQRLKGEAYIEYRIPLGKNIRLK